MDIFTFASSSTSPPACDEGIHTVEKHNICDVTKVLAQILQKQTYKVDTVINILLLSVNISLVD